MQIYKKIAILALLIKGVFMTKPNLPVKIFNFYKEGFTSMTIGRSLWLLIIIKVFVLFFILKLFFFPNILEQQSKNRSVTPSEVVRDNLLR